MNYRFAPSLRCGIVDSHCHLGTTTKFYIPDSSPERLIREMERLNIDISIQSHTAAIVDNLFAFAFQKSHEAYHISNGRILSYVVFNPNYPKETMKFVQKSLEKECFVGIKIHPSFHKTWADDEKYNLANGEARLSGSMCHDYTPVHHGSCRRRETQHPRHLGG